MADIPWDLRRRALKDSIRHDKRVKEAIRQNLKELIAEENIITAEGKKLVKIPLRYLDHFLWNSAYSNRIGNHCYLWLRKKVSVNESGSE